MRSILTHSLTHPLTHSLTCPFATTTATAGVDLDALGRLFGAAGGGGGGSGPRGISTHALSLLPTYTYGVNVGGGGGVCSVCLEEPKPGEPMRRLTPKPEPVSLPLPLPLSPTL